MDLYDLKIVRTLFLEFENPDWEKELEEFHGTDVDVPAMLTVDGNQYPNVGVRFRGMSSYMMLPSGSKRSLNLSLDLADAQQRLYGYKTLNLLNAHEDPTFMGTVLYSQIARQFIPAPKANFVRVVINGESWGLYANAQQFDKIFAAENFGDDAGTRWKASGSPGADGGLRYLGDNIDEYRRRFEIKGKDNPQAWQRSSLLPDAQ
jgi:spore coat protein CotH